MSLKQALAGLLQTFAVFAFFGAGFFFTSLPFAPEVRLLLADFLRDRPDLCTFVGICFLGVAVLFLFGFLAATRGRHLTLKMGVKTDAKVVQKTLAPLLLKQKIRLDSVDILRGRSMS